MRRAPLSIRQNPELNSTFEGPHEGVPSWLRQSLLDWFFDHLYEATPMGRHGKLRPAALQQVIRTMGMEVPRGASAATYVIDRASTESSFLLDLVDNLVSRTSVANAQVLHSYLAEAGSVWTVNLESDPRGLERRVTPEVRAQFERVVALADRPGHHLRLAWTAAFGRTPNASESYTQSIKAVEAAACGVVPHGHAQDKNDTLGKVIRRLADHADKFVFDLGTTPEGVRQMCSLLWAGQTDRHGSPNPQIPVTGEAAEAAVHLATTLVAWFVSGRIRPKPLTSPPGLS